jgi:single-strand DNA-binding protein
MLNHITIMGRLTKDPELRSTISGKNVANFTVAVDRDYNSGSEKQTDFIECVAWKGTADFVSKYFHKGSMIILAGKLQSRKWQDRDGNNRINWEVVADSVYFGESKNSQPNAAQATYQQNYGNPNVGAPNFVDLDDGDGELPF